ncbi:unnamed protein product [Merluccius merluccius]
MKLSTNRSSSSMTSVPWSNFRYWPHPTVAPKPPEQEPPAEHIRGPLQNYGTPPWQSPLQPVCERQMLRSAGRILQDPSHVLLPAFE